MVIEHCRCECHLDVPGLVVMHVIPCCETCPKCKVRFRSGLNEHMALCVADPEANKIIERVRDFAESLEAGKALKMTQIIIEHTPDGPLTTRVRGQFVCGEFIPDAVEGEE